MLQKGPPVMHPCQHPCTSLKHKIRGCKSGCVERLSSSQSVHYLHRVGVEAGVHPFIYIVPDGVAGQGDQNKKLHV